MSLIDFKKKRGYKLFSSVINIDLTNDAYLDVSTVRDDSESFKRAYSEDHETPKEETTTPDMQDEDNLAN